MINISTQPQQDLWPDWVLDHPWLVSFLAKAEAEARNSGDTRCDHFHIQIAYLRLGEPVSDWFNILELDAQTLREDIIETLGMNANAKGFGDHSLDDHMARADRMLTARNSDNPAIDVPLEGVSELYTNEILDIARNEAGINGDLIDERHFLIALALNLFQGDPPSPNALRYLTRLTKHKVTSYGDRMSSDEWSSELATSHGKDPSEFPYDING